MKEQSFGEFLRKIREKNRISMRTLAHTADMDPAYLSRIENGKTGAPKRETVERLAQALCAEQALEHGDCERLTRRLLVTAGHLQNREQLIDDLADRFSARLREQGFPEEKIDEALARVPLATMRKVLLGEEKLEIGYRADYPGEQVRAREDSGEAILSFDLFGSEIPRSSEDAATGARESASSYLERHANEFTSHRRMKRALSGPEPDRSIRAGRTAEIRVHGPIGKEQEYQLRLIAKLITTILEEK